MAGPRVDKAQNIAIYIVGTGSLAIGAGALGIGPAAAPGQWYAAQSGTVDDMQRAELSIAQKIVARARSLQGSAERSALTNGVVTVVILLLVLIAALAVARSMVRPLRRLREGALDIATVQLPERVRQLSEAMDPSASLEVTPIEVMSANEIGQVARAFDQVHSEAVRLAGNEAMLRRSFNAMFVNLSRRSQSLIERLVRLIDSLEQNEQDPGRLANLFSMDHLVTRMRRNSENLLLLAGHDTARKWSGPVPLADVARAAASEIEQYGRVTLRIQPGVAVAGQAASDVVHLLAELIENATVFSPEDAPVAVSAQELTSGGVLIEVSDSGVGVPEARLAEMNWRLDHPPVIDVSVSRHMGLFAVARLAERHGIRVRLRPRPPQGLTALVWLPDDVADRDAQVSSWPGDRLDRQTAATARHATGAPRAAARLAPPAGGRLDTVTPTYATPTFSTPVPATPVPATSMFATPAQHYAAQHHAAQHHAAQHHSAQATAGQQHAAQPVAGPRETVRAAGASTSIWFRSHAPAADTADGGSPAEAPSPAVPGLPVPGPLPARGELTVPGELPVQGGPSGPGSWADDQHAAQVIANPVRGDHTAAGLPVRVPRANLLPGSAGGGRSADDAAGGRPAAARPSGRQPCRDHLNWFAAA